MTLTQTRPFISDAPDGEVTLTETELKVVFRRRYNKPIARVWAAVTVPERLAHSNIGPKPGQGQGVRAGWHAHALPA